MNVRWIASLLTAALVVSAAAAEDKSKTLRLNDFENEADLTAWNIHSSGTRFVTEGVTHGVKALELTLDAKGDGAHMTCTSPLADWSEYDALILDVLNLSDGPVGATLLVGDKAWQAKNTYWNRHNGGMTLAPGKTTWIIPVRGMFRGEPGSRNNDIKWNIDPDSIVRLDFGFGRKGQEGKVVIDNLRLVKSDTPAGVWAFDFGPASQAVMLGWKAISPDSKYDSQQGFGWQNALPNSGVNDTTFGPALLRDFLNCRDSVFRVDVPPGKYTVTVFYETSGYWGEEQAQQAERSIQVDGKAVWASKTADGSAHTLYRFENVEPVGMDIWDTYMAPEIAKPAVFEASAGKDGLSLKFLTDHPLGSKVSGLAIHRADNAEAAAWLKGQMGALATEFRSMAVCLDKPAATFQPAEAWDKLGLVAWPVDIEDTIKPNSTPSGQLEAPAALQLSRLAVLGEYEPFCLAIRPLKDLGTCQLRLEGGGDGVEARTQVVWYNTSRGFGSISYTIQPHTVREQSSLALPKDVTREILVTCRVSDKAKPGDVKWTLVVEDASHKALLRVPLTLSIHNVRMERQSEYVMGFFGLMPPEMVPAERQQAVLQETLTALREHGMNGLSGGPNWRLTGWKNGQPVIDFGQMDSFMELIRRQGFTAPIAGYGGLRFEGVDEGYVVGQTGRKMAQQANLPFDEALMKAWQAVDEHARKANWPTILYSMCDETRVREVAQQEVEYMTAMAKVTKQFPKTVRTIGFYSVNFNNRSQNQDDMLYWHQAIFHALDISSLNGHDQSVVDEAAKTGKEIQLYNQGTSRYSFGPYQWSEYRKGVKARWQWHLNILHGYQFFDLDGREPDTAMICYGRNCIYPTIAFERCREGAEDFYLCQALWNLIEKGAGGDPARQKAKALLEEVASQAKSRQRQAPAGFDADRLKAQLVAAVESLGGQGN